MTFKEWWSDQCVFKELAKEVWDAAYLSGFRDGYNKGRGAQKQLDNARRADLADIYERRDQAEREG